MPKAGQHSASGAATAISWHTSQHHAIDRRSLRTIDDSVYSNGRSSMLENRIRFIGFAIVLYCAAAARARAAGWAWTTGPSAFFCCQYQQRKLPDFIAWGAQNTCIDYGTR